jgi:hypothetical protein
MEIGVYSAKNVFKSSWGEIGISCIIRISGLFSPWKIFWVLFVFYIITNFSGGYS